MSEGKRNSRRNGRKSLALLLLLSLALIFPMSLLAKKKKEEAAPPKKPPVIDYSNIVWPNPPAIARIKYQAFYAAEKISQVEAANNTKKQKWMDRLAGTQPASENTKVLFQLAEPYGIAIDSKGNLYVADQKVGAIFIFNTETRDVELIKNKEHGHFVRIIGLAMDDNDRLFVSDPGLRHVLVFNAAHKPEDVITDGMVSPGGLALDRENRLLYVADVELDQVLVYDADSLKLIRKIGTTGHKHELTSPGDFAKPGGVAVDHEGNLYVADTLNNRIEIFDADGKFISAFGKAGDGPGYFSRPKGVAIDSDGHIWVADGMQDRVQVFNREAQLLISFGGHGLLPGQFQGLVGIATDKMNRVFTSEIYPGRVQQFRYVTDAEAEQLRKEKEEQREKKSGALKPPTRLGSPHDLGQGIEFDASAHISEHSCNLQRSDEARSAQVPHTVAFFSRLLDPFETAGFNHPPCGVGSFPPVRHPDRNSFRIGTSFLGALDSIGWEGQAVNKGGSSLFGLGVALMDDEGQLRTGAQAQTAVRA